MHMNGGIMRFHARSDLRWSSFPALLLGVLVSMPALAQVVNNPGYDRPGLGFTPAVLQPGDLMLEQGLPDWRDAVRMNSLLELRQRARPCAVDHPTRCSSRSQAVPAARRQRRAVSLIDNGLRGGQADAEDGDAQAAAPYRRGSSID